MWIQPIVPWGSLYANPCERAPLEGDALNEYNEARDALLKLLKNPNSDCARFLRNELGINGTRIARTVRGQRPFDGTKSTISMGQAGTVRRSHPQANRRVSDYFATGIPSALQAGYAQASTGATFNDVYYLPHDFTPEETLHEALHTFLGAKDPALRSRKADATSLMHGGCNQLGHAF